MNRNASIPISCLLFLFFVLMQFPKTLLAQAGSAVSHSWKNKLTLDFTLGTNIDMPTNFNGPEANLLGRRPTVVPSLTVRTSYFITEKFALYTALRMDYFNEQKSAEMPESAFQQALYAFFFKIFEPLTYMHPNIDAGVVYRLDAQRWQFFPALGIGYGMYLHPLTYDENRSTKERTNNLLYKQKTAFLKGDFDFTAHYYLSPRTYFTLRAGYQIPLQRVGASLTNTENGILTVNRSYSNADLGRNFMLGLGFGFVLGKPSQP